MFHSFFLNFLARSRYLSFISLFFNFTLWSVHRNHKVHYSEGFLYLSIYLFLLVITTSGRQAKIRWSICFSKSYRNLCVSFSGTDSALCIYHLFVIIIIIIPWEFFSSILADGHSQESERQQVSSRLHDSSQSSDRPHRCCSLNGLCFSFDFQFPKSSC